MKFRADRQLLLRSCQEKELSKEELKDFHKVIANIKEEDRLQFKNWLKIYKALNYDIFENLTVDKVYRFSKYSAVIELSFNGKKEYDLLAVNEEDKTVGVMNVKNGSVKRTVIRRLLIPETAEEALMYAISEMDEETVISIGKTMKEIETNGAKYDVTKKFGKYLGLDTKTNKNTKEEKTEVKEDKPEVKEEKIEDKPEVKEEKTEVKEPEHDTLYVMNLIRNNELNKAKDILENELYKDVKNERIKTLLIEQFVKDVLLEKYMF